ncbi:hypothetical protein [Rhizobium sp. Root482]|uniref:hypothetical protein n=1 Tax=Rhizobium sp. Root482 TaxID=1736543 RepID=UPI0012E34D8B|nr:hypothetical protein [Rhizobium sp. Root482]
MSESAKTKLHSLLFEEGRELVNIKFMPGKSRGLTAARLSDAAADAIRSAIDGGLVNQPPRTGMRKCKLEAFH